MTVLPPLSHLAQGHFETPAITRSLIAATRKLAELKGVVKSIPNQSILINSLGLQEAKDSSAIENIVTTHDEIYKSDLFPETLSADAKEVANYRQALQIGWQAIKRDGFISINHILQIQAELEKNTAGFRKLPGTVLKDSEGNTVYTPPQDPNQILELMGDLERFTNNEGQLGLDPIIKMAIIHHQFESIHPFYDGNGRTGRIINVLYLVNEGLLEIPVLYLSRQIVKTKPEYYRLLQAVRNDGGWEPWILYMLQIVEATAADSIQTISRIKDLLLDTKHKIRRDYKFYSQDLINTLFRHPYTKIEFIEKELGVSRLTATKYLDALVAAGLLQKHKAGRSNYYINVNLMEILTSPNMT